MLGSYTPVQSPRRRQFVQAATLGLLVPAVYAAPAPATLPLSTAINRTARFRALSQRCAKAYCQLSLDVLSDNAQDVMATAQHLIQRGFDDLARGNFPGPVRQQIAQIQVEADALMSLLQAPPTKATTVIVSAQADKMLLAADATTTSLEGLAQQGTAKLVNLAGRQRMLSQRLAKNYFLAATGNAHGALRTQLAADSTAFSKALETLAEAPLSTPNIRNELALGQQQWLFFQASLGRKSDTMGLRTVATTSERLLEVMNNLATLYDNALKDLLGQI